ncbi:MAG: bis-aminopropyl spermidine synthase family protein [Actinobacteria bacterium]|nr:bis-aminopropyl spermidine synthase family protein [Actinomycetota bacterium]
MPELSEKLDALRREWGLDFARVRCVLAALSGGATVSELVATSGLPRRDVESVVEALGGMLVGDAERLRLPTAVPLQPQPMSQVALTARMTKVAAGLPPSRWRLDHVPAIPETMAQRALHLAGEYELDGASVLCLGDHDLTSLAVASVEPGADVTVVDIDEPVLDHVRNSAAELGFAVTPAWSDLRLALAPSLVGTADLVFTDPPYTTEGVRLFLVRALEALRPTGHERLAFCFGTGERHLVKALEVQSLLADLRLALEAMLPGFNHYDGAEAIGARSDLYICRPTRGARVGEAAGARRSKQRAGSRIYTRGPSAAEAPERALPEAVVTGAPAAAGDGPVPPVGEGWPDDGVGLAEYFGRVAAWATAARPGPFPYRGTPVINTHPDDGAAALRTLLLIAAERAVLIAPRRDLTDVDLLAAAYDITAVPTGPGGDPAVLCVNRHDRPPVDDAGAVLRHVLLHPGAKIVNAWRDALLAIAAATGDPMTKNEARARIAADTLPLSLRRLRTWEMPLSALRALGGEIARSVAVP